MLSNTILPFGTETIISTILKYKGRLYMALLFCPFLCIFFGGGGVGELIERG